MRATAGAGHAPFGDVISVGGVNPDTANATALQGSLALVGTNFKVRAHYSDYGPHIDVVAPTQVPTTNLDGGYIFNWSGTSAASPHVAGTAALVVSRAHAMPKLVAHASLVTGIPTNPKDDAYDQQCEAPPAHGRPRSETASIALSA